LCVYLTPDPSPARITGKKLQALVAGEGSLEERGRSPLSSYFSLSNIIEMERGKQTFLRGGIRG
jgi:hypothetical protein